MIKGNSEKVTKFSYYLVCGAALFSLLAAGYDCFVGDINIALSGYFHTSLLLTIIALLIKKR